jgi:thioesterase domain-containing protein
LIVHPHGLCEDAIPPTIEEMARDRLHAVRAALPNGPYLIGGHCNGALVAFEMARQLAEAGEQVPVVVLIEAPAPDGSGEADDGGHYLRVNNFGGPTVMRAHDRMSDAELRYVRAMDRYAGRPYDGHVCVVKATDRRARGSGDMGWSRLVSSVEVHEVPGDHSTLLTTHVGELAARIREALTRATAA